MDTSAPEIEKQNQDETQSGSNYALANVPLFRQMAVQYDFGDQLARFETTLIKTVFPSDKQVTRSQLLMFLSVAKVYKLNPFVREIFAFPAQDGGIVPVVSVDGWIQIIERQPQYDGVEFEFSWATGREGQIPISCTAIIYRKDRTRPTRIEEYFAECARDTKQWKLKPIRMLRHKALIQAARYAFGIAGIYDEDEAERILEGSLHPASQGDLVSEIRMPQRVAEPSMTVETAAPTQIEASITPEAQSPKPEPPPVEEVSSAIPSRVQELDSKGKEAIQKMIDEGQLKPASAIPSPKTEGIFKIIGKGRAQRLYAILNRAKVHTEAELFAEFLEPLNLEHLSDLPLEIYDGVCLWAEGKNMPEDGSAKAEPAQENGDTDGLPIDATPE